MKTTVGLLVTATFVGSLLAQKGVNFYSIEKELALGQQMAAEFRKGVTPVSDPGVTAYVLRISRQLAAQVTDAPLEFQFEVVTGGEIREPAALPGGFVFIPLSSLVEARDESEFAGLLAHGIAHAALRHGTRSATRQEVVNRASIPLIFMGGTHAESRATSLLIPIGFMKHQREFEMQADASGVELASRAGFDPRSFKRWVERTHPADNPRSPLPVREVRIAALQERVAALPVTNNLPAGDEFRRAQQTARELIVPKIPAESKPPTLRRQIP